MPLWIVQADKSVIDGHNDFLNDHFVDFIRQVYYTFCATETTRWMKCAARSATGAPCSLTAVAEAIFRVSRR